MIPRRLIRRDRVTSTMDEMRALAEAGEPDGAVLVAAEQTAGRGREGRAWHSPRGGLWATLLLRPDVPAASLGVLSLAAGSAVAAAVEATGASPARVKWPNDVLLGRRKVAGVLVENRFEADRLSYALVGIGANVDLPLSALPEELRRTAGSISDAVGAHVDLEAFLRAVLSAFAARYERFVEGSHGVLVAEWVARSDTIGRRVAIEGGPSPITGVAVGVEPSGALVVDVEGRRTPVLAGDVRYVGAR
ncbi:MAG: biotin--[acetyl-CoA-carboxylase] ligase [Methanobacteriota archaeon]